MVEKTVDILVVGGGLTGAAFMLALGNSGYRTLLVEANTFSPVMSDDFDARSLALSPASIQLLKTLSIWPTVEKNACPITTIHVSEQKRFGSTILQNPTNTALGYVVEMHHLYHSLSAKISTEGLMAPARLIDIDFDKNLATIETGDKKQVVKAGLIVAADGTHSFVRQLCGLKSTVYTYPHQALVANIGLARPHHQIAYERFTTHGPLALLPLTGKRMALVWSLPDLQAKTLSSCSESAFLQQLQKAFGYRLGRFLKVGKRTIFPLNQSFMKQQVQWPVVFVGNAAHTLHPVAGQGFNLGLRDIALLAQCIHEQGISIETMNTYQQRRRFDQQTIRYLTHGLVGLFTSQLPGAGSIRGAGLFALDNLPFLQQLIARYASGYAGIPPDLACGMPLREQVCQ